MRKMMTRLVLAAAVAGVSLTARAQVPPGPLENPATQAAANVPVKAVVLFSSGVGYFEHFGTIRGDGSTELRFKTNQINDILKSLILQDVDGGKVSNVTYPSQDPIAKTLKSFQVDITANPPLADLLNQLRGAKVTIATGSGEKMNGTILGVEKHRKVIGDKGNEAIEQPYLNLLSAGKIASINMEGLSSIQLEDAQLQEELNKALLALSSARDQDKKPVKINFTGQGERHVRIGYVVETPIWKTSYRLILGEPRKNTDVSPASTQPVLADGSLQGWAIVENQTDNDWTNVQLSLVSGRPISFIEDLYQPMYVPRPVVKPELFASLRPQTYGDGIRQEAAGELQEFSGRQMSQRLQKMAPGRAGGGGGGGGVGGGVNGPPASAAPMSLASDEAAKAPMDATSSVSALASATNVGELFQYTVGSVSLPRQRSAMIPIITDPVEVERVSIYNAAVLPRNPLNGARLKNTTQKHLLSGPITVLDGATYAGDAQIDNLPPGQERFLSYGVDLQMLVDAKNHTNDSRLQTGRIIKGVLYLTRKDVRSQDYVSQNKSDHDKAVIIEHPRDAAWTLVETDKPMETTDNVYRFKGKVAAGKTSKLAVKEQIIQQEEIAILPADIGQIEIYRKAGEIPKAVKDALAHAMQLKQAMVDTQRQIDQARARLAEITAEQNRIRENMRTVNPQSQYSARLMTKLNDQETLIEKTQTEIDNLQKALDEQRKALETYLQNLDVG